MPMHFCSFMFCRNVLASILWLCSAIGFADEADRLLLQYGHQGQQNWTGIGTMLVERKDLIQADLDWAAKSSDWRVRTFAEVIRLRGADPQAFARETARIDDFLRIYKSAIGEVDQNLFAGIGRGQAPQFPSILVKPLGRLPPQRIPWPVLANAMMVGTSEQTLLASLLFWSEPRIELLGPCWQSNIYLDEDAWFLEEGILALGSAAIPFLNEQMRLGTNAHPNPHHGMAPRLLVSLGDSACFAEFRKRLRFPVLQPEQDDWKNRQAMLLDEDTLAGMEILAKAQDSEALPLILDRFTDYLINGRERNSVNSFDRKSDGSAFPDNPALRTHSGQRWHVDRMAGALACYGLAIVRPLETTLRTWVTNPEAENPRSWTAHSIETIRTLIGWVQATNDGARRIAGLRWNLARQWNPQLLVELRQITGESLAPYVLRNGSFSVCGLWADCPEFRQQQFKELHILATIGDATLVPIISNWVDSVRQQFVTEKTNLEGQRGQGTVDAQLLREQAGAMLSADRISAILQAGDEGLLALIRIGGLDAIATLRKTLTDKTWSALAEAGLLLLEGHRDDLIRRVNADDVRIAEAAAQVLWIAGSTSAQPGLIAGAARRRGESHALWLERASELGPLAPVVATMPSVARAELRLSTLCAAISSEAADPAAATQARRILLDAANHVSRMHAWRTGLIVGTGRSLAKPDPTTTSPQLSMKDRNLLEAECLFGTGVIRRGIAANALAALGDERSIPVIAASADMGAPGGSNPVIPALESYGSRAATQAVMVPKLLPAQANTGLAITAHRTSTRVLADLGDIRAVEQILEGFKTLAADRNLEGWNHRLWSYLKAADKCTDARLFEPLLAITQDRNHTDLSRLALLQLGRYTDPRGEVLLLNAFAAGRNGNDELDKEVTMSLLHRWGPSALDRLLALAKTDDVQQRGMACLSLAALTRKQSLTTDSGITWPIAFPDRTTAADRARELTLPILIANLQDADPKVQRFAADAMVTFIGGEAEQASEFQGKRTVYHPAVVGDRRGVPALTAWLQAGDKPNYRVIECLAREGDEATGKVFLGLLTRGRPWLNSLHSDLLLAIGRLHPPGAVAALERIATEAPLSSEDHLSTNALYALSFTGTAGQEVLRRLQVSTRTHTMQAYIADLLSKSKDLDLKLTRQQLDACLADPGAREFHDEKNTEQAKDAHECICLTFLHALIRCNREAARSASAKLLNYGSDSLTQRTLGTLGNWRFYHPQ